MAESVETFGRKACDVPGCESAWVQFKTSGYPRRLRREWDEAKRDDELWALIAPHIAAWSIMDLDGQAVALPDGERAITLLDNVEDAVVVWLTRAFTVFWLRDLTGLRPNSSGPSPVT